jgi:hypothetical protein
MLSPQSNAAKHFCNKCRPIWRYTRDPRCTESLSQITALQVLHQVHEFKDRFDQLPADVLRNLFEVSTGNVELLSYSAASLDVYADPWELDAWMTAFVELSPSTAVCSDILRVLAETADPESLTVFTRDEPRRLHLDALATGRLRPKKLRIAAHPGSNEGPRKWTREYRRYAGSIFPRMPSVSELVVDRAFSDNEWIPDIVKSFDTLTSLTIHEHHRCSVYAEIDTILGNYGIRRNLQHLCLRGCFSDLVGIHADIEFESLADVCLDFTGKVGLRRLPHILMRGANATLQRFSIAGTIDGGADFLDALFRCKAIKHFDGSRCKVICRNDADVFQTIAFLSKTIDEPMRPSDHFAPCVIGFPPRLIRNSDALADSSISMLRSLGSEIDVSKTKSTGFGDVDSEQFVRAENTPDLLVHFVGITCLSMPAASVSLEVTSQLFGTNLPSDNGASFAIRERDGRELDPTEQAAIFLNAIRLPRCFPLTAAMPQALQIEELEASQDALRDRRMRLSFFIQCLPRLRRLTLKDTFSSASLATNRDSRCFVAPRSETLESLEIRDLGTSAAYVALLALLGCPRLTEIRVINAGPCHFGTWRLREALLKAIGDHPAKCVVTGLRLHPEESIVCIKARSGCRVHTRNH